MEEEQEPRRVPARRRKGSGAVTVMTPETATEVAEGDIYEPGVWPWEITEDHGWERVSRTEARASARAAKEEFDAAADELAGRVAADQSAALIGSPAAAEPEGGS